MLFMMIFCFKELLFRSSTLALLVKYSITLDLHTDGAELHCSHLNPCDGVLYIEACIVPRPLYKFMIELHESYNLNILKFQSQNSQQVK